MTTTPSPSACSSCERDLPLLAGRCHDCRQGPFRLAALETLLARARNADDLPDEEVAGS